MSVKLFIAFSSMGLEKLQPPDNNRCAAFQDTGERCNNHISEQGLQDISRLYSSRNQCEDDDEDDVVGEDKENAQGDVEYSDEFLTKLALLCLCHEAGHNTQENVKAAVRQWGHVKPPSPSPVVSAPEQHQQASDWQQHFNFRASCEPTMTRDQVDDEVKHLLQKPLQKPGPASGFEYIHIMGHKGAPGVFRIVIKKEQKTTLYEGCYKDKELNVHNWEARCPNAGRVRNLVLREFSSQHRIHECKNPECRTKNKRHINWVEASSENLQASITAWGAFVEVGYPNTQLPGTEFSQESDRWTKWAQETAKAHRDRLPGPPMDPLQEPSDNSLSHADTTFDSVPTPSTSDTPAGSDTGVEPSTQPPADAVPHQSHSDKRIKDMFKWGRNKIKSIIPGKQSHAPENPGLRDLFLGVVQNVRQGAA